MKTKWNFLWVLVLLAALCGSVASPMPVLAADNPDSPYPPPKTVPAAGLNYRLLAKAQPDECFDALGLPSTCDPGETPNKVNQAYVWGLTYSGNNLWFGTAANVVCLASALIGTTDPVQNTSYVCEFGESQYVNPILGYPLGSVNPAVGDWRPPEIWAYNTTTNAKVNMTPTLDPNIYLTAGLRSAGSLGDMVFLGGPGFGSGVNLFAFNGATGDYLGSTVLTEYNNIRKMLAYNGVLYLAVGSTAGGTVLKWTGTLEAPFQFEVVATLDSDAAEIVAYNGRIFVSTWPAMPGSGAQGSYSGLWMSPAVPAGGLTSADALAWQKVFQITDYEPDPVTAYTVAAGGIASFGGYLYWSTLHVPGTGLAAFEKAYGEPANEAEMLVAFYNTYRPTIVFRGKDLGLPTEKIEVLYGDATLPVYNGTDWITVPNNLGATPLYGGAGYGNFFNTYTWSMEVYNNQLYVGTFDWSYVAHVNMPQDLPPITLPNETYGADLFRFDSTKKPAKVISNYGVGNYLNYGIRNMLVANGKLYLGSANPMNLETAAGEPNGGWELIELSPKK
jgi:hypothetical protein